MSFSRSGHARGVSRRGFIGAAALAGAGAALGPFPAGAGAEGAGAAAGRRSRTVAFTEGTNAAVALSPDGGRLVIEVQGVLWALARGGGAATALTVPGLEPTRPAWSPDGSALAFCAYQDGGFHLWTMSPDGTNLRQLTSGPWDDRGAAWSPDGSHLAFASERAGDAVSGGSYDVWTVEVATGRLARLTDRAGVEDYDPSWHPDGDRILFVRADDAGARTIASVPASGGPVSVQRTVDSGSVVCPVVSRDGRLAYVWVGDASAATSYTAASASLAVDGEVVSGGEDVSPLPPCWTPDGGLVYFADGRITDRSPALDTAGRIPFTARTDVPSRPEYRRKVRDFDSTDDRAVLGVHLPALSPDGRSVVFCALNALWLLPIGGQPRKLLQADPSHYVQMPSWSRDGRSVLYVYDGGGSGGDGLAAVHRLTLEGGADTVLATGGRFNPALSPDGTRLACQDVTGNLLLVDLATGTETLLAAPLGGNGLPGRPSWSPDGRYLALCDRNRLNQRFREGYNVIRVIDTRDKGSTAFLPLPHTSVSDRCDSGPVWSPDGAWLALVVESALWVLPVGPDGSPTGRPRRLTDEAADHPSWSGDSTRLLYLSNGRLRLIGPDGTGLRTVALPLRTSRSLPPRSDVTRIHAARLWDGTGDDVREDVDIVVSGNRITAVEPHRPGARRAGERLIDATGCTVLPGLWDAHTHPYQNTYGGRQTRLNLAYGITGTASLGGFAYEQARIRESVDAGVMDGPRFLTTGELLDGARVAYSMGRAHRTPEGVRRSLERAVALDYDFVKTYVRAPGWIMAQAARTAHERLGVPAGSHLLTPGVQLGQDLTTHLSATQRQEYGRVLSPTGHTYQDVHEIYRGGDFAVVITPFSAFYLLGDDPSLAEDARVTALMPPWDAVGVQRQARTAATAQQRRAVQLEMAVYRRILDDGGALAMGTDAPLTPIGLQVHLGLRALHRYAGLSTAQALRSATVVPARLFGVEDDLGTVEAGKLADLTVVEGDPFRDFADLARTSWVMRDGFVHRRQDLVGDQARPLEGAAAQGAAGRDEDWYAIGQALRRDGCCAP
ncbi:Tol biopolymer transport system component/imidazolonepropionase-like amidohydrolase [Kitasatospora sp. MAA19]|nr:Tol biopolymer transport system component/imidazolonepropionase-like amidohydrolase [Kitasatospora sp. MAA19]